MNTIWLTFRCTGELLVEQKYFSSPEAENKPNQYTDAGLSDYSLPVSNENENDTPIVLKISLWTSSVVRKLTYNWSHIIKSETHLIHYVGNICSVFKTSENR